MLGLLIVSVVRWRWGSAANENSFWRTWRCGSS